MVPSTLTATCDGQSAQLTFLDAETLAVVEGPFAIFAPADVNNVPTYAWLPNGRFAAIATFFGAQGETYAPGTPAEEIEVENYDCFFPETTSSSANAEGRNVSIDDGVPTVEAAQPGAVGFGCAEL